MFKIPSSISEMLVISLAQEMMTKDKSLEKVTEIGKDLLEQIDRLHEKEDDIRIIITAFHLVSTYMVDRIASNIIEDMPDDSSDKQDLLKGLALTNLMMMNTGDE